MDGNKPSEEEETIIAAIYKGAVRNRETTEDSVAPGLPTLECQSSEPKRKEEV